MQYILLIHDDEQQWGAMSDEEQGSLMSEYGTYTQSLLERGAFVGGNQLQPTQTATTVRVRDGERLVTDGPFAETKEQLGGFYVIEAESLDEAIDWAAQIPSARLGSIEVRPLVPSRVGAQA
jgi:hypothetical protein